MTTHHATPRPRYRRASGSLAPARSRSIDKAIALAASGGMLVSFAVAMLSASGALR